MENKYQASLILYPVPGQFLKTTSDMLGFFLLVSDGYSKNNF